MNSDLIDILQKEYPLVDDSVIAVIVGEYSEEEARKLVADLYQNALSTGVDWADVDHVATDLRDTRLDKNSGNDIDNDDRLKFLIQSFPKIPVAILKHKLKVSNGDLVQVTDLLLNKELLDEVPVEEQVFEKKKREQIKREVKKRDKRNDHDCEVRFLAETLQVSSEEASEIYAQNENSLVKALVNNNNSAVISRPISAPLPENDRITTTINRPCSTVHGESTVARLQKVVDTSSERHHEARQQAQAMYKKSRSDRLYRSVAGYYSEQASQYNQEAKSAVDAMCRRTIEQNSTRYSVDFHGAPTHVAVDYCTIRLEQWWTTEQMEGRVIPTPLKLITGTGRHSTAGIPKIKNAVRKLLTSGNWRFEEETSFFIVKGVKRS